jgi:hypothetical protein
MPHLITFKANNLKTIISLMSIAEAEKTTLIQNLLSAVSSTMT